MLISIVVGGLTLGGSVLSLLDVGCLDEHLRVNFRDGGQSDVASVGALSDGGVESIHELTPVDIVSSETGSLVESVEVFGEVEHVKELNSLVQLLCVQG